jgi:pectate disaccharide-lyase
MTSMHRFDLKTLAVLSSLGLLAACGSDVEDPSPGSPGSAGSAASTGAAGASSAGTASSVAGSANPSGGSTTAQGGMPGVAGSGVATGGSGVATGGTGNGMAGAAGTAPNGGSANGGSASSTDLWIAPNGADSNPGTEAAPLATVAGALPKVKPGLTIWLKPGTYKSTATVDIVFKYSGSAGAPVKLFAAPGGRPLLDFTGQVVGNDDARGINLVANYWHIKGIELKKTGDNCIGIAGSNNIIEDVIVHECGDTGIQITAPSSQATDDSRAANNQVLNCDSWGNIDTATGGENADGFAAKLRIGPGNVFKGCRAWNNADDGWDLFAADDVVTIENSWAFSNGKALGGSNPAGDGNGFKLGGAPNGEGQGGAVHLVNGSFAFENKACGFVRNNNPDVPKLTKCGAKSNGKDAYCSLSVSGEVTMTMSASAAISAARNADGSLPAMK